jgi:hypothetical protein
MFSTSSMLITSLVRNELLNYCIISFKKLCILSIIKSKSNSCALSIA